MTSMSALNILIETGKKALELKAQLNKNADLGTWEKTLFAHRI